MAVDKDAAAWEYPDRLCEGKLSGYFYAYAGERAVMKASMSDTICAIKMLTSYFK